MKKPKPCKDCLAMHVAYDAWLSAWVGPDPDPRWQEAPPEPPRTQRPAPHPGPRCTTHHREKRHRDRQASHDKRVQGVYGLEAGEYAILYDFQGGKCAICQRATGATKRLAVDHHHASGVVRLLACGPCNQLIGHGREDPEFFRRVIRVLETPPAVELLGYRGGDEMETWKPVPGYGGWYEASSMGHVRSWRGVGNNQTAEAPRRESPLSLKQSATRGGYLFVSLCTSGTVRQYRTNRLILLTFAGDRPGLQACHINGDLTDNRLSNLYWGTGIENMADAARHGTLRRGKEKSEAKLSEGDVMRLREMWADPERTMGPVALGAMFNVSGPTAWKAATGRTWTHLPMPEGSQW